MAQVNSELKITMYWGDILYDTAICGPTDVITIGRDQSNTFVMDLQAKNELKNLNFTLVKMNADRSADLFFDEHYDGHIRLQDKLFSLATAKTSGVVKKDDKGVYSARLSQVDKADVVIGHVSFYFNWVKPAQRIPMTPLFKKKQGFIALALLILIFGTFYILKNLDVPEPEKPPERLVTLEPRKPRGTSPTPSDADPSKAAMGAPKTADGGAQAGPSGKAETAPPPKPSAASLLRKANLGSLVGGLTKVGARSPSAESKADAVEAAIPQEGTGGFSTEGLKKGGGGKTTGIGRTVGAGEGGFSGTGKLGLAGNSSIDGTGAGGGGAPTQVGGGLDRGVIESIIKRREDRIRLCYERQLNFYPNLAGKVAIHFVIGKTGQVIESRILEDTMKNSSVNSCILFEVKTWTFPNPEGGTLVNVDYPFVFESSSKH
jgi:hypothetical protein